MHALRDAPGDMLRSDLEVAGDMIPAEILQIGGGVRHYQIVPYPRADEDPLDARNFAKPA